MPVRQAYKKMLKIKLLVSLFSVVSSLTLLTGCGDDDSGGGNAKTISTNTNSSIPAYIVAGQPATLETELSVSGSQSSNAALFTLGADASDAIATITAINYPDVAGLTFTQIIPNGGSNPDCVVGLSLTNEAPVCSFKVMVEAEEGASADDNIEIVSNVQTVLIPIVVSGVAQGSLFLPAGYVAPTPVVVPNTTTNIKVTNQSSNAEAINTLSVTYIAWLSDIMSDLTGGTVSTASDGKKTVAYTENGLSQNLAVGQSHTFSFSLDGTEEVTDALLEHYNELISNPSAGVITVNGANLRNPLKPSLTVFVTPATMTESVTLSDPDEPQTVIFLNLSNSQLRISGIDTRNLPDGVSVSGGNCSDNLTIEPSGSAGSSCTVLLDVDVNAIPQTDKSLMVSYIDPQGNSFEGETVVTISGVTIKVDLTSISLPLEDDQTTNVSISNTAELNWLPSTIASNYKITVQGQSAAASNISVIAPIAGTNCLLGASVSPAASCNIGIETTAGVTEIGNYVLTVKAANNLTVADTTIFSVTGSLGYFDYKNAEDEIITELTLATGAAAETITLVNLGATTIASIQINTDATDSDKFTISNDSCNNQSLVTDATCTFDITLSDQAVADEEYTFSVTGTNASNSPANLDITTISGFDPITLAQTAQTPTSPIELAAQVPAIVGADGNACLNASDEAVGCGVPWAYNGTEAVTPATRFSEGGQADGNPCPEDQYVMIDNLTGLMWAKNGAIGFNNDPVAYDNSTAGNNRTEWQNALTVIDNMNNSGNSLCGYTDWRLPNIIELNSIINLSENPKNWLVAQEFDNIQIPYWTSSTDASNIAKAWQLNFNTARLTSANKAPSTAQVIPVRGQISNSLPAVFLSQTGQTPTSPIGLAAQDPAIVGADGNACLNDSDETVGCGVTWAYNGTEDATPAIRFVAGAGNESNCITDTLTGFMWPKNGDLAGETKLWNDAISYANDLDYCGHSDWRLPNRNELMSMVNYACGAESTGCVMTPAAWLNSQGFDISPDKYWTSSIFENSTVQRWYINFNTGELNSQNGALSYSYVWPVRGSNNN